jgi:hypothetical protein
VVDITFRIRFEIWYQNAKLSTKNQTQKMRWLDMKQLPGPGLTLDHGSLHPFGSTATDMV